MQNIKQAFYVEHVLDHRLYPSIGASFSFVERAILPLFHATKSSSKVGQA